LPESSLTTAVNYRAHSHSDRQEVGTAIAAQKSWFAADCTQG